MGFFGANKKEINEYAEKLTEVAKNGDFTKEELADVEKYAKYCSLRDDQREEAELKAVKEYLYTALDDGLINVKELATCQKLLEVCSHISQDKKYRLAKGIDDFHAIYKIGTTGEIPALDDYDLGIMLKRDEIVYYCRNASYQKKSKKTQAIKYSGLSTSVKICKGVRYRIGSISPVRETAEFWETQDTGYFFITNQRIGFSGESKSFSFPIAKIFSISIGDGGLTIFKEGRETPFVVACPPYDLAMYLVSCLLNGIEKIEVQEQEAPLSAVAAPTIETATPQVEAPAPQSVPAVSEQTTKSVPAESKKDNGCLWLIVKIIFGFLGAFFLLCILIAIFGK